MGARLEKRVAYNYNIQSAYIMSAKGEIYDLVELLGNAGVIDTTTAGLINLAKCGISRIGESSSIGERTESLINLAKCGISHIGESSSISGRTGERIESLINLAKCGISRIGEKIENAPDFEGDVEEVIEAREFLGVVYENLKERLDTLYEELYVKIKEIGQSKNTAIADVINGQDEVRNLQDLNRAYMSNLREDMQNTNYEAEATNLDLDMRLLILEMERM